MYDEAINTYVGKTVKTGIDYLLQDDSDGNGIHFVYWNITDIAQPTMEQVETIINNISFSVNFSNIVNLVTQAQINKQQEPMLLANKFIFNCSDETMASMEGIQKLLNGTGVLEIDIIDLQGTPSIITLDDINIILGNTSLNIKGQIPLRRLDLHNQEQSILRKILLSQPYEIKYI